MVNAGSGWDLLCVFVNTEGSGHYVGIDGVLPLLCDWVDLWSLVLLLWVDLLVGSVVVVGCLGSGGGCGGGSGLPPMGAMKISDGVLVI